MIVESSAQNTVYYGLNAEIPANRSIAVLEFYVSNHGRIVFEVRMSYRLVSKIHSSSHYLNETNSYLNLN